jgi:tetratricopeptide (TPR) repeat protein
MLLLAAAPALVGQAAPAALSPAVQRIMAAEKAIEKDPERHQAYNDLALALARRARETSDPACYTEAEKALEKSLRLAPDNYEARKAQVWLLLGRHEFAAALKAAQALNRRMPDDVLVYGFLGDAHAELGNYKEAEEAVQWMLDLRPGNVPGLTRAAYLRELFGDIEGAIDLMDRAYQRTAPGEVEDRAWILTQLAHLQLTLGRVQNAEPLLNRALRLFPGYHYALAGLAEVRIAQQRHAQAAALLRQRYQAAPHPENLSTLADALRRAGRSQEAANAYAEFERLARREMGSDDNANRELIFYYAGYAKKPAEALCIARREIERRRDVHTLHAYAWALHANGERREAQKQIRAVLAVGVRDPHILDHARVITGNRMWPHGAYRQ